MHNKLLISIKKFYLAAFIAIVLAGVISWHDAVPMLKNGSWRSVLIRPDGRQIVFNFDVSDSDGKKVLYIINGGERLLVDSVRLENDSVFIQMPFFESRLKAKIMKDGSLQGWWVKRLAENDQVMPFAAYYGQQRFSVQSPARYNVSGRWAVHFLAQNNQMTEAVGVFEQQGSHLTGSFLTASGDYRYLEGIASGDSILLSGFNGGDAYLFTAKVANDNTITGGNFYSGPTGMKTWSAEKNTAAALPDGYGETALRAGESKLNFTFKSTDDKTVSITDDAYKGKVVVVQIMGSWCPNCMDETNFLSGYYNASRQKGIEMIALAYERTTDLERSRRSIQSFQRRFDVRYPVLITGVTYNDSLRTEKTLPQLTNIKAFPTTIFIGKNGMVKKIYTGFTGPGTGTFYEQYKKEFDQTINALLHEQ